MTNLDHFHEVREVARLRKAYDGLKVGAATRPRYVFLGRTRHELVKEGRRTKSIFVPGLGMRSYRPIMGGAPDTYFMRADGTAANKGAASGPGSSVSACMDPTVFAGETFSAADVIRMADDGGVYRAQITPPSPGSVGLQIVIEPETGDSPVVNGADLITTWADQGSNIWDATVTTEPIHVFFDETKGTQETAKVNLDSANEWFWTGNVLSVFSTSDPDTAFTSPGIEAGARARCIRILSKDFVTIDGIELKYAGNAASGFGHGIQVFTSDTVHIKNCIAQHNFNSGFSFESTSPNGQVLDSTSHHNGHDGSSGPARNEGNGIVFDAAGTVDCIASRNTCHDNDGDGIAFHGPDTGAGIEGGTASGNLCYNNGEQGIEVFASNNVIVEDNICHDNATVETLQGEIASHGTADNKNSGTIIRRNTCYRTDASPENPGIQFFQTEGGECNYNLIYGDLKWGIRATTISTATLNINNNTIGDGITTDGIDILVATSTVNINNNIIYNPVADGFDIAADSTDQVVSDNNCVFSAGGNYVSWGASSYTLAQYISNTTNGDNSITSDPLFINVAGNDYHLKSGSPCIEVGAPIAGLTLDNDGIPLGRGKNPDMGAFETLKGGARSL